MRPFLRMVIKVCRQEEGMPLWVEIEMTLRQARKFCRHGHGGGLTPYVEIKYHYELRHARKVCGQEPRE